MDVLTAYLSNNADHKIFKKDANIAELDAYTFEVTPVET